MTRKKSKIVATFMASLMVVSMVGAAFAPAGAASTSGPEGMLALGDAQVHEDIPEGADVPIRADDLEGAIYASDHADTLSVTLTTPERADEHLGENANVLADDDVAIVLSDDEVHEGRDVAVDADVLEAGVGYLPSVAYGTHSSGSEWHSEIGVESGVAIFEVPEFSSNSVTFSGGIELTGTEAASGTTYSYELENLDGVDDFEIDLEGARETEERSTSTTTEDGTLDVEPRGTSDPSGGTLKLTGEKTSQPDEVSGLVEHNSDTETIEPDGNSDPENAVLTVSNFEDSDRSDAGDGTDSVVTGVDDYSGSGSRSHDIDVSDILTIDEIGHTLDTAAYDGEGFDYTLSIEGETIADVEDFDGSGAEHELDSPMDVSDKNEVELEVTWSTDDQFITFSDEHDLAVYSPGTEGANVNIDGSDYDFGAEGDTPVELSEGGSEVEAEVDAGGFEWSIEYDDVTVSEDPSITLGEEDLSHSGVLEEGETVSEEVDLSTGESYSGEISSDGPVTARVEWVDVSETVDPVVTVNGHETEHEGTLSEGETTSLATNDAWLEEGTNDVEISMADPNGGPDPLVDFEYRHDAAGTTQEVDVEASSWTESFNVSNTFVSETQDAKAVLTFDERVVEIDDLEVRENGGEWTTPAEWELNGTDLHVQLGDVAADTSIDVRATGHKIRTYDGDVDVVSPTVEGDDLATEVEISALNDNGRFGLRVDGTELGDRVHYASDRSWEGDPPHAEVTSSGTQILRADDANVGSTMTVGSSSISVEPESGATEVVLEDADEPRFSVRDGDTVGTNLLEVTYHDTVAGERYVLWSVSEDREVDADRASSPVTFTTDGDSETYTIRQLDREGSVAGGAPAQGGSAAPLVLVLPAVGISVVGLFWAGRRFGGARGVRGNVVLLVGSAIVSVAAIELVTPGSFLVQMWRATVFALGDAAAGGIGAVVAAIAVLVGMWQLNERTDRDVPAWVLVPAVSLAAVLALEAIRPGSVLGVLEEVILEVGALLVLLAVGIAIWRWRQRDQAAQTPDTEVTFDLGEDD